MPRKSLDLPFWARVPNVRQLWAIRHTERAIPASLTIKVPLHTAGFIISGDEPLRSTARRLNPKLLKDVQIGINFLKSADVTAENCHH